MSTAALTILHVDMDAFYASIEQRDRPELRGKPVIVGGSTASRGVVCAASYEARVFGVHSAMPAAQARRLCPQGVFLPVRMSHYAEVGAQVRDILLFYTPLVQPLSLDEAFLDVHGCEHLFGLAPEIGRKVKEHIRREVGLVASVGVASCKFLAKLASDLGKPDGFVVVDPGRVRELLDPLPVGRLWGVGAKAEARLHGLGLRTIGQIASLPERVLAEHLGESGRYLWQLAQGIDDRIVVPDEQAQSVSTETTFPRDIGDRAVLRSWLLDLVENLGSRVRRRGARGRTVSLKVRVSDFRTFNRAVTLDEPTDLTEELWQAAVGLFEQRVPDDWLPLRLLGVGVSGLTFSAVTQGMLFDEEQRRKQRALDKTVDEIRARLGRDAIKRAGGPPEKS
jgi:DNA polymerase IV